MSFRYQNFTRVGVPSSTSPQVYSYKTTDDITEVLESGYFADPRATIEVGDLVYCYINSAADDAYVLVASSTDTVIPYEQAQRDPVGGWAQYADTTNTAGSPQVITQGTTAALEIDALSTITTQIPVGVTSFYDGTRITPDTVGDFYNFTIAFTAQSSAANGAFRLSIDISAAGDGSNTIWALPVTVIKGAGVDARYSFSPNLYSLNTFKANGALIRIESVTGNLSIHDALIVVSRTHKGIS